MFEPLPISSQVGDDSWSVLRSDHRRINGLFDEYRALCANAITTAADKHGCLARIGAALRAHAQIEEELFYPLLHQQGHVAAALHQKVKALLESLASQNPLSSDFDEQVAALGHTVQVHMDDEEKNLFPLLPDVDPKALGALMATRRAVLLGDQGAD
jgi:hemerythrin superfamily protein